MKKFILMLAVSLFSFNSYAIPAQPQDSPPDLPPGAAYIDINGLTVFNLNSLSENSILISARSSGALSSGICRIIIRSELGDYSGFSQLANNFTFTKYIMSSPGVTVTPTATAGGLIFDKLMQSDYSFERIYMQTKDGRSIGENVRKIFGDKTVAIIAGTCYPKKSSK